MAQLERISRDYFAKLDLRIGKVIEAQRIEGSRKLIKLIVDLGSEKRQILAGLAEYYKPEELVGRFIVVVANMEPRIMLGLESQGMLLATCGEKGKPLLLTIQDADDSRIGEKVC
ncbi:methionine--tRNA ligase subunit beta [Caldivirga sp.]|uniref:methionine--tRNA ligase subunit beta n=1 Tax=Caldivirga sp. TaxID=2080243 RepID=UPI0025C42B3B|nr:methionine--tRNA ligase subunit beta [Caldivirga sp.]